MNEVLSKKKSEIVLNKFASIWSKSTYWRYEGATFDPENPDADELENPSFEILDYFRREFGLQNIEDLFTEEYAQYRSQQLEKRIISLENEIATAMQRLSITKEGGEND
ncbi:MAG: hypothetical protein RML94_02645 [Bacteroidia bacterium]|nr:hypothetical protein [Bacteroidia bacterium]